MLLANPVTLTQALEKMVSLNGRCLSPNTNYPYRYAKSIIGGIDNSNEGLQVDSDFDLPYNRLDYELSPR